MRSKIVLIDEILKQSFKHQFIRFSNSSGKYWILPKNNIKTALGIYHPSSFKGKLFKILLPFLHKNKIFQFFFNISNYSYDLQSNLLSILEKSFGVENLEFSIFGGTPSVHQKITIQLFKHNKILGYCKLTNKKSIQIIFKNEKKILEFLNKRSVKQIPKCLFIGKLNHNTYLFIQNTVKTKSSNSSLVWKDCHWDFLRSFQLKTSSRILFEDTDFYKSIKNLILNKNLLSENQITIVNNALKIILKYFGNKKVNFSAYHADFTPWNMIEENGKLYVFDFEYTKLSYPPFLDRFHFFTQVSVFNKNWSADKIFKEYNLMSSKEKQYFKSPDIFYLCYLIDIVSFYVNRDRGAYDKNISVALKKWISLMTLLLNRI